MRPISRDGQRSMRSQTPAAQKPRRPTRLCYSRQQHQYSAYARMKPGATVRAAQEQIGEIAQSLLLSCLGAVGGVALAWSLVRAAIAVAPRRPQLGETLTRRTTEALRGRRRSLVRPHRFLSW